MVKVVQLLYGRVKGRLVIVIAIVLIPFPWGTATLTPGCNVDVERDTIMRFTQADGVVRQTIPRSITANPPQHTEYGRTAAN